MKMDENSVSSPEIQDSQNYNISRKKSFASFVYDHGVHKKTGLLRKEKRRIFFMNYEYTVLSESNYGVMQQGLNSYGKYRWKLVSVVWNNRKDCLVAMMMRER